MEAYLAATEIIDWQQPTLLQLARKIASTCEDKPAIAQACFEWVRDNIYHSVDYRRNRYISIIIILVLLRLAIDRGHR
jgi:hypothetical protein